ASCETCTMPTSRRPSATAAPASTSSARTAPDSSGSPTRCWRRESSDSASGRDGSRLDSLTRMARRIVHQLVDDLDGTVLEVGSGETVLFSLDGVAYEIDLTDDHAAQLREALRPYVEAGRRITGAAARSGTRDAGRRRTGQRDYAPIRA